MRALLLTVLLAGIAGLLFAELSDQPQKSAPPLPPVGSRDPNSLDDVILSESFDDTPEGYLPPGWTRFDLDSALGGQFPFYNHLTLWQAYSRTGYPTHSGPGTAINGYNANGSPNNDWMITPRLDTLVGPISLSYWASAQDALYPETFEVRVSTTDIQPASFTHLVRAVHRTGRPWTQFTDNLSEFAGAPFYIAFHYCAVDDFALKLDDILLQATRPNRTDERTLLPQGFSFAGNYPNPFNSQTEFQFELARPSRIELSLYNTLGQKIAQIAAGSYESGSHTVFFDARGLASGIYIARLSVDGVLPVSRKVALIR